MTRRRKKAACGADVLRAIREAYPDGMVTDDSINDGGSYYGGIRGQVGAALRRIKADLVFERPPEGRKHWDEGADPEEDPPAWVEDPASYDLFFLALQGKQFEFEGEMDDEVLPEGADEPALVRVPTVGRIGCAVGISIVAPFAVVRFTEMEFAESGTTTLPDIWPHVFNLDGSELDIEAHYEELFLEEGTAALCNLREEVARVLGALETRVLSENEIRARVPDIELDLEHVPKGDSGTVTVADALFFQTI